MRIDQSERAELIWDLKQIGMRLAALERRPMSDQENKEILIICQSFDELTFKLNKFIEKNGVTNVITKRAIEETKTKTDANRGIGSW